MGMKQRAILFTIMFWGIPGTLLACEPIIPLTQLFSGSTLVAGSFQFDQHIAGSDITLTAAQPLATDPRISLASGTDMGAGAKLIAVTGGDITLSERSGDFRIDRVTSSAGNVSLAATGTNGSIVEVADEPPAYGTTPWVIGNSITLSSRDGGIGSATDFLEINSSNQAAGAVIALARNGVYLTETAGDLNIDKVLSRISDVVLIAQQGSILESGADSQADVQGQNIDLIAASPGSRIGDAGKLVEFLCAGTGHRPNDGFQIEQYAPGTGRLVAEANAGVYLMETSGAVNVLEILSPAGDVELSVHDSVLAGEDLNLLESGGQSFLGKGR